VSVGAIDQVVHRHIRRGDTGEHFTELVGGDDAAEPVGTQQVTVTGLRLRAPQITLGTVAAVQSSGQHRAAWVHSRLLGGDAPVVQQEPHQGVVMRELVKRAVAQQIGARVPDVGEGDLRVVPEHYGQRGPHAAQIRFSGGALTQP
jgi:hypothetical protein